MRLEEWQSWLDLQFLDGPVVEPKPDQILPMDSLDLETVAQQNAAPPIELEAPAELTTPTQLAVDKLIANSDNTREVIRETELKDEETDKISAFWEFDSNQSSPVIDLLPSACVQGQFVEDTDLPAIESYLPHLRTQPPKPSTSHEARGGIESDGGDPELEESSTSEAVKVSSVTGESEVSRVEAVQAEGAGTSSESTMYSTVTDADFVAAPHIDDGASPAQPPSSATIVNSNASANPATPKRARHVRNVRPAEGVHEVGPDLLWSLVPKHIQVLVAMGSDEVAQNSYKRSFKETRIALIERLLDPTLSLEDTARLLNVCPTTIRRYTNRGLLTHQRTQGDQRRFKLSDVLTFLEAQSRPNEYKSRVNQDR